MPTAQELAPTALLVLTGYFAGARRDPPAHSARPAPAERIPRSLPRRLGLHAYARLAMQPASRAAQPAAAAPPVPQSGRAKQPK